jgi:VanZ family protein
LMFITGRTHSIVDLCVFLFGSLFGVGLVIAIAYFLNRHWKRKEGIEDEK